MRNLTSMGCSLVLVLLAMATPLSAQTKVTCPNGYYLIQETVAFLDCKPYGGNLPVISPGFFVSEREHADLKRRITALKVKHRKYEDQVIMLKRFGDQAEKDARDMVKIQREVIANSVGHTLGVIRSAVSMLVANGSLSPAAGENISRAITAVKAGLHRVLARGAEPDSDRRIDETIKAIFELKNLITVSEAVIPARQLVALKSSLDTIPSMVQISERIVRGEGRKAPWKTFLLNLDDALVAGGSLFPPLGAMHSTANIIDGEIVLWLMRRDREAVDGAFIKLKSAQQYYKDRMRETDELLKFYEGRQRRGKVR